MGVAQLSQSQQISRARGDAATVTHYRFDNHRCDVATHALKHTFDSLEVVQRHRLQVRTTRFGNAAAKRCNLRCFSRVFIPAADVRFPHHLVVKAVEAALDDDNIVAPCEAARRAHRAEHRLGAGIGEPQFLDIRAHGFHQFYDL